MEQPKRVEDDFARLAGERLTAERESADAKNSLPVQNAAYVAAEPTASSRAPGATPEQLHYAFETHKAYLHGIARKFISQSGLAQGKDVDVVAGDVVTDVYEQAAKSLHRFDPALSPSGSLLPWLHGIALNVVRSRVRTLGRTREIPASSLGEPPLSEAARSDSEWFDSFARLVEAGVGTAEQQLEAETSLNEMLALVSPDDAHVLRLVYEVELDGNEIAHRLGISPAAARQRHCRALGRLKTALQKSGPLTPLAADNIP